MRHRHCRHHHHESPGEATISRRDFFSQMAQGFVGTALTGILMQEFFGSSNLSAAALPGPQIFDLKPKSPHFQPKAKAVIQLFMNGGPSHMDMFDYKPALEKHHGELYSDIPVADVQDIEEVGTIWRSPFKFARHGKSGIWVSDVLPHTAEVVDELAIIRSMWATSPSHTPAVYEMHYGRTLANHAAMGSWVVYGLGSENQNLPAYVVLDDPDGLPVQGSASWQSGYLPPIYQGTRLRCEGTPILNLQSEQPDPPAVEQIGRDLLSRLDDIHHQERPYQPRLDARIASYQLAAKLQLAATDALDISQESPETLAMYGVGDKDPYETPYPRDPINYPPISGPDSYARRCIMARRLVERGVRFIQIYVNGQPWDMHAQLETEMRMACHKTDKPIAALIKDLKQRGLLDSTLVIWGGEFGRMPMSQHRKDAKAAGRDHNPLGFTTWMAGGGVKGGMVYGATDDFGMHAVENRVSVPDWHATILHQLGLHHEDLFYERSGFKERLTFTHKPRVIKEILA